jgi:hypothetical protein
MAASSGEGARKSKGSNAMEQGLKAIALAAIMLAYSATADAVAWKAKGYGAPDSDACRSKCGAH